MKQWRHRPLQATAVLALSALLTACIAIAPLYFRAMQQALAQITVAAASSTATSLQLTVEAGGDEVGSAPAPTPEQVADALEGSDRAAFASPTLGYTALAPVHPGESDDPAGLMIWRDGQCERVVFTDGRCPEAAGEIAVSGDDAERFGWDVGRTAEVTGLLVRTGSRLEASTVSLAVVGVYQQRTSERWFGQQLTGKSGRVDPGPPPHLQHDDFLAGRATFEDQGLPVRVTAAHAWYPVERAVDVDDLIALGRVVEELQAIPPDANGQTLTVVTGLGDLAATVEDQIDQTRVTVPLLVAQLGLLSVVVLWLVLLALTEQRRPEIALMQLRGRGRRGARRVVLAELLPLTLAGLVPGAVIALVGCWVARGRVLPGAAPFEVGTPFLVALALSAAVLGLTTILAVDRVTREPLSGLLRRVPPRRSGFGLGVAEALVLAGAGALVVAFATGGLSGPAALAAPGLLAVVVGLVLGLLIGPAAARIGRVLLRRGALRSGIGLLDVARSAGTRRVVAVVTIASALTVFAVDAYLVGRRNHESAAAQSAGAPMVSSIDGVELADIDAALAEVDPSGRQVTPVVRVLRPGDGSADTLAVRHDGFAAVALLPPDTTELWPALAPSEVEPVEVRGDEVSIDVDASTLRSVRVDGSPDPVRVGLDLVTRDGRTQHATLGSLADPTDHVRLRGRVPCADGCVVTGVWVGSLPGAVIQGRARVHRLLEQPAGLVVSLGNTARWAQVGQADGGTISGSAAGVGGLDITVNGDGESTLTLGHDWIPRVVPTLTVGPVEREGDGAFTLVGIDGEEVPAEQVGTLPRVPGAGPRTYVADLETLTRGHALAVTDIVEIWYAEADADLERRTTQALADRGIVVSGTRTLADVRRGYDETAAAWSLQLSVLVAVASLLIALLVLLVSIAGTWRLRTRDLASLRMTGVGARVLARAAVTAQVPAVLLGAVAGSVAGLAGAQLAMPLIPLFATEPVVSTLDLSTAWSGAGIAALSSGALLIMASVVIGRRIAARASVDRIREAGL